MTQIIKKCNECQIDLHIALIDYNKTFDTIDHEFMLESLKKQGIPDCFIKLTKEMYIY